MTIARDWHWRWWCPCGYNYAEEVKYSFHGPMCPECGRPGKRLELIKGRWKKEWDGNKWDKTDWEVWVGWLDQS